MRSIDRSIDETNEWDDDDDDDDDNRLCGDCADELNRKEYISLLVLWSRAGELA